MNPVRITSPSGTVLTLAELRQQVDADPNVIAHDDMLMDLQAEAVAKLDGYRGILGRAILPQTWREEFCDWGTLRLALPDATAASVTYLDADGDETALSGAILKADALGSYVVADGPETDGIFVEYTAALPEEALPAIKAAVKLYVGHYYDARGLMDPKAFEYFRAAFFDQINHLRAVKV